MSQHDPVLLVESVDRVRIVRLNRPEAFEVDCQPALATPEDRRERHRTAPHRGARTSRRRL